MPKIGKTIMRIVFATGNKNKMTEIKEILGDYGFEILSMKDLGLSSHAEENGTSFSENALIKARDIASQCKDKETIVIADDSGLEIDALGGEMGIYSSRYLGEDTSYHIKNAELIKRLDGIPPVNRTARFKCAIAAVFPDGEEIVTQGKIEGRIGYEERGSNGFGYDPIFYLPDMSKSTAEIDPDEKNSISHRGIALRAMKIKIDNKYNLRG